MKNTSAVFPTTETARAAIDELAAAGVDRDHIRYLGAADEHEMADTHIVGDANNTGEVSSTGDVVDGALKGAGVGAGAGLALGVVSLLMPPLGAAAGVAVAAGAIVGAASGAIGEALEGVAYTDEQRLFYKEEIEKGGILIAIDNDHTDLDDDAVNTILEHHGGKRAA